jgi:hypothetical protein
VVTVIDALTSFRDVEVEAEWNSEKGGRLAVGTRANSAGTGDLHKETVEQVDDEARRCESGRSWTEQR